MAWQKDHQGEGGGNIRVPDDEQSIDLQASLMSLPQLQRLRRQFINNNRQHALAKARIKGLFVEYLNDNLQ